MKTNSLKLKLKGTQACPNLVLEAIAPHLRNIVYAESNGSEFDVIISHSM